MVLNYHLDSFPTFYFHPLSAPVLSWLFVALGKEPKLVLSPAERTPDHWFATPVRAPQSNVGIRTLLQRPLGPTLRANPFPEVTDLFCRLPLSTLFYQLEASHLGDLMRL